MVRLSVNVNKVATLRNSRGGRVPDIIEAVDACLRVGAPGITVHPREDQRHITPTDVLRISERLADLRDSVEFNIEGDPRPGLMDLVCKVRPHQCTLVPVIPGEVTSQAGWPPGKMRDQLVPVIERLHQHGIRVSLFVEPDPEAIAWVAKLGADRVELYTEPYARAWATDEDTGRASFSVYAQAAEKAHSCGLGVNAGHDLDLDNLPLFAQIPHLDEVSIGHALMSRALFFGIESVVREYLALLDCTSK